MKKRPTIDEMEAAFNSVSQGSADAGWSGWFKCSTEADYVYRSQVPCTECGKKPTRSVVPYAMKPDGTISQPKAIRLCQRCDDRGALERYSRLAYDGEPIKGC